MKGVSFQNPLEFNVSVEGEKWNQGDELSGMLTVKNRGTLSVSQGNIRLHLAWGELKKVRAKAPGAFKLLQTASLPTDVMLSPDREATLSWKFPTDPNCAITDSSGSLFLLYGQGSVPETLAQLQLPIHPHLLLQDFLKVLTTDFRFVIKTTKSGKDSVEVKLAPPGSRGFAAVDFLSLSLRLSGETLAAEYVFHVKKIEASAATLAVKKLKRELAQSLTPDLYRLPSGRTNFEYLESMIRLAVDLVEAKILL